MFMLIQLYQTFYSNRNKTCIFRTLQTKVFHFRAVVTDSIPLSALQNGEKYSQNTTIFIRYERVDHIAVLQLHVSVYIGHRQVVLLPVIKENYTICKAPVIGDEISFT